MVAPIAPNEPDQDKWAWLANPAVGVRPDLIEAAKQRSKATGGAGAPGDSPAAPELVQPSQAAAPEPPPPRPELVTAPAAWRKTRRDVGASLDQLRAAIRKEYAGQPPALLADIEKNMTKLDVVLARLDNGLADSLAKACEAEDAAARIAELKNSRDILKDYLKYVTSERLITQIDANPFGVQTNVKRTLAACLSQIAKALS